MSVPASIEILLKKHNVTYSLAELPKNPTLTAVEGDRKVLSTFPYAHAHLLQNDDKKRLLVIIPQQAILDLDKLNRIVDDHYLPVTGDELSEFSQKLGLAFIPALPKLANLPTIVDRCLAEAKTIAMQVGEGQQYITLCHKDFQQLLDATKVAEVAIPLEALNQSLSHSVDTGQITESVTKFTQLRVKQRLEETLELPALPTTAQKIIQLRVDPNADVSNLCEVIELDPSLAAQVVSWAASPYYSAPGSIRSIHDAIVRVLGFDMVLNLALGLALGNTLSLPQSHPKNYVSYWQQAVYVATCTEAVICAMPRDVRPSFGCAYLSGLLHNFGYLIIAEVFRSQFAAICQHIDANTHADPQAIETHIIGVSRDQLAAWLMSFWHMPEEVSVAIRYQTQPDYQGPHSEYAQLIYLTKKLLRQRGIAVGVSDEPIETQVLKRFGLSFEAGMDAIDMMLESSDMLDDMTTQMAGY